jgi:hypothetical protein
MALPHSATAAPLTPPPAPFSRPAAEQLLEELAGVAARLGCDPFRRAHGDESTAAYAEIGSSS